MVRAIIGFLALLGALSLAHAASGPFEDSIYGTPAEARWAPFHANYANVPACDDRACCRTSPGGSPTRRTSTGAASMRSRDTSASARSASARTASTISRAATASRRALVVDPRAPPPERPKAHTVVYNVGATEGIIGMIWGVEWCVVGFDRELAYAPACLVLRPIIERRIGVLKEVNWFAEYGLKARY